MKIITHDTIRNGISMLLEKNNLTPHAAALLIDEDPSNFNKCINGKKQFSNSVLVKLTMLFGISIIDLITYPDKWIQVTELTDHSALVAAYSKVIANKLEQFINDNLTNNRINP